MVALQIRDVPEELRDKLTAIARDRGQSLQMYLLDIVSDEVRRRDNLTVLQRLTGRSWGTRLSSDDVVGTLRAARQARDAELGVPETGQ
jgi:antitoxin FitA